MKDKTGNLAAGAVGITAAVALVFGLLYLWTWLIVTVLAAFGVTAPFWPVMGAWVILAALFRAAGGKE